MHAQASRETGNEESFHGTSSLQTGATDRNVFAESAPVVHDCSETVWRETLRALRGEVVTIIGERQAVVAWWVFYRSDSFPTIPNPVAILEWIEEAEGDLAACDYTLATKYDEYFPRKLD